mgnify:CR=1 FL=1
MMDELQGKVTDMSEEDVKNQTSPGKRKLGLSLSMSAIFPL